MYDHIFTINADKYTVADEEGLVTGKKYEDPKTYPTHYYQRSHHLSFPSSTQSNQIKHVDYSDIINA